VTYQFPGVTPRGDLLILVQPTAGEILPKGQAGFNLRLSSAGGWFIGVIVLLWVGLIAWFVIAQVIARRR
jgi:hypothetical protein